jgi:phage baseplate assembly protein W
MAEGRYININYPFNNSPNGFFLEMNSNDNAAIKADLVHLILTRKGQRLYLPDFGTDLVKFIFDQNDDITLDLVKEEIKTVVKKYLPNLTITNITVTHSDENEYTAVISIDYIVTEGAFQTSDSVIINY